MPKISLDSIGTVEFSVLDWDERVFCAEAVFINGRRIPRNLTEEELGEVAQAIHDIPTREWREMFDIACEPDHDLARKLRKGD